ncbi:MAG: transposase [Planctomycetes bacterium]|nr:transposase [Planctomycetota bacterium]
MRKSRAYRATRVKNLDWEKVFQGREGQACCIGMDVSKEEVVAVLRWSDGKFERPWRLENPQEVTTWGAALARLAMGRELIVALEPSGTYGDALRQALGDAGITPYRVSPKAVHDYAEVFDGVPSQHDGKDAAVVAELAALGKSSPWPYEPPSENDQQLALWVDWLEAHRREFVMWCGRLEGLVARHWPEAWHSLSVRQSAWYVWYRAKKEKDQGHARGALVGVMRRLALALYQVSTTQAKFDATRLFPGRNRTRPAATKV